MDRKRPAGLEPVSGLRTHQSLGNSISFNYVDDRVLLSPNYGEVVTAINKIKAIGYDIKNKGYLNDYLGVNIKK